MSKANLPLAFDMSALSKCSRKKIRVQTKSMWTYWWQFLLQVECDLSYVTSAICNRQVPEL